LRVRSDVWTTMADLLRRLEMAVDAVWRIVAGTDDPVVRHAAEDLTGYFLKSMGVEVGKGEQGARRRASSP